MRGRDWTVSRSKLVRRRRRLNFEREHYRNLLAWARSDLERDVLAADVRTLTWQLVDVQSELRALDWTEFHESRSLSR